MPCVCPRLSSKLVRALKAGIVSHVSLITLCESKVKFAQSCLTLCDPTDSPWNSPGQNIGVGSLFLLQGIFSTKGSNPGLPHCREILYQPSHKRGPITLCGGHQTLDCLIQRILVESILCPSHHARHWSFSNEHLPKEAE